PVDEKLEYVDALWDRIAATPEEVSVPDWHRQLVRERVAEYRGYWEEGARLLGADFVVLREDIWEVRLGGRRARLANFQTPFDDPATRRLAGDKAYCYGLAQQVGAPVPEHLVVTVNQLEAARTFLRDHRPPFVVKPARDSASALGVTTHVETWSEFIRAAAIASLHDSDILIERMIAGESCRLLFLGGRMIHAVRRRGLRVVGDGRSTIAELVKAGGHGDSVLNGDQNSAFTLASYGVNFGSVPKEGESILVRSIPPADRETRELRTVYDEAVTALCGPELVESMRKVVEILGSEFVGIDLITNDLGLSLQESGGTFLEVNTTPGIHHHYVSPGDRKAEPVAKLVLAHLLHPAAL
ncbi:MAG: addiction module protein, partial [Gemmatimonadota bacterium]